MMLNARLYMGLGALVVLSLLFFGLRHHYINVGEEREKAVCEAENQKRLAAVEKDRAEQQAKQDALAAELAQRADQLAKEKAKIQKDLANERSKNRVYSDCKLPTDGVRLYNDSIRANKGKATR